LGKRVAPEGKFVAKIRKFVFLFDKREIWRCVAPAGQKTILDEPLSKCNTDMAALRAGLPVKIDVNSF